MDPRYRVLLRVVTLQEFTDGVEFHSLIISTLHHRQRNSGKFYRLFSLVDDIRCEISLADIVHDPGEGVEEVGELRVGEFFCGDIPV